MPPKKNKNSFSKIIIYTSLIAVLVFVGYIAWLWWQSRQTQFIHYREFGIPIPADYPIHGIDVSRYQQRISWEEVKAMQVNDYENDPNNLIPSIEKYSRYKKDNNGKMKFKGNNQNHCWRLWHDPVITWDGAVVPCCFDKDAQHRLGSLQQQTFKEVWHNKEYQSFRTKILQGRKNIDICANCSEGVKVWG